MRWFESNGNTNSTTPYTVIVHSPLIRPYNSYPNDTVKSRGWGSNRKLAGLDRMVKEFGKKVAMARHENIMWARRLIAEQDWWLRRIGTPVLAGLPRLVQRRGRVCGESNYYRAMLC